MKKIFKYVLLIFFINMAILFLNQSLVKAVQIDTINTIEELKTAFEEKAIIEGNKLKLTDNVILKDNPLEIEIPELIIDFNGKTIECKENGFIYLYKKVTMKDSSTTDKSKWGGMIFNIEIRASVEVKEGAELIINSGKFVDGGANTYTMLAIDGKLTINDAVFSTTRTTTTTNYSNYMIRFLENSESIIHNGSFTHTDGIILVASNNSEFNNARLTINGGTFKSVGEMPGTISIDVCYPNKNNEISIPKIVLNNCYVENKYAALEFYGGSREEEYRNVDTKILTINGGTYKCNQKGYAAFKYSTGTCGGLYVNPKDIVIENGIFEGEGGRFCVVLIWTSQTVNIKPFVMVC